MMPKPRRNEAKTDFLQRCTKEVVAEGKNADQAYAMCNAYWDEAKGQRAGLNLAAPLTLAQAEEHPRTFRMTAYTGQILERWWGKLVIDTAGITAKPKMPILREHLRDRVVGYSTRSWREGANFYLAGEFSQATQDGQEVLALAAEGFPWQASIGIWPRQVLKVADKEEVEVNSQKFTGPLEVWKKSFVGEVSFVALGADDETAAIVLQQTKWAAPVEFIGTGAETWATEKEGGMEITLTLLEQEAPELLTQVREAARSEGLEAGRAEGEKTGREAGLQAERERVGKILSRAGLKGICLQLVQEGAGYEAALEKLLDHRDQVRAEALKTLGESALPAVGSEAAKVETYTEPDRDAPLEERAKAEWDQDAKLRSEFDGLFETYLAFRRQEEAGLVKMARKA
jgi:hypothetical protein